jgi:hypothetical protein
MDEMARALGMEVMEMLNEWFPPRDPDDDEPVEEDDNPEEEEDEDKDY